MTGNRRCPACKGGKAAHQYICFGCWSLLSDATRRALARRDDQALPRLASLYSQIVFGIPLEYIKVDP